jgi:hypothetical protein
VGFRPLRREGNEVPSAIAPPSEGEDIAGREIALVWSEETRAAARRRPGAILVSFGWREYAGEYDDVALGEDGLDYGVTDASYRLASELAQSWSAVAGRDLLEWEGVPVGRAAQTDAFNFFQPYLRLGYVLDHVLATWRPSRVAFADDGSLLAAFLARALAARGVACLVTARRRVPALARRAGAALRRRAWPAMFFSARRDARRGPPPRRLECRMTRPGGPVFWGQFGRLDLDVYEELRRVYGAEMPYYATTPAAARAARRDGAACDTLFDRLPPARRTRECFRALAAGYRALEREGLFARFGLPPGAASFFGAHFPFRPGAYLVSLAMSAAATERFVTSWRPSLLVHMSDAHVTGRLVAEFAARRGVPSLVIQNHITGGPAFGYLPLSSTVMAAWGPVSRDWMLAGGAPPERVAVVGSPYAALARRTLPPRDRDRSGGALVVATNNYDPDQNRVMAYACAAYGARRGRRLLFRPHPSEPDGLYRTIIDKTGLADAAVAKEAPLAEILAEAAVVVTSQSGVGVDAVVAGLPLVHVNLVRGLADYIPYVEYGAARGVVDVADLPRAIDEAVAAPPERFAAGREAFARAYLGAEAGEPFANLAALARELEGAK